jgi:Small metal-binding protein
VDPRCPSTIDAKGKVAYADAGCAERYRFQTKENAFYDRYADKAAKHARAAEIAGNEGNMPDMIEDAELSLDHAKEARRASNNPDLAAGIAALRQAISLGQTHEVPGARVGPSAQTIKGELSRSGNSSRDGGEQYVVRDSQNREVPISLTPEMSRQVQVGDVVEAQVDSNGQVTSISKAQ